MPIGTWIAVPAHKAARAPQMSWPWAPMLKTPVEKPMATPRPAKDERGGRDQGFRERA